MKPTVLFLFNSSQYAPLPWCEDGRFNVVSVDHDDTDHETGNRGGWSHPNHTHIDVDLSRADAERKVLQALRERCMAAPVFVMSFAPCTDLAVSGAAHFERKREADPMFQHRAVRMAKLAAEFDCPYIVENPVSVLASMWRKPTGYVHPWEFALDCPTGPHPEFPDHIPPMDLYNKKTGLWCGHGAEMPVPTNTVAPKGDFPGHTLLGGKSARTKYIRSLTPRGLARAIYKANCEAI